VINADNRDVIAMTAADLKKIWEPVAEKKSDQWCHAKPVWPETPLRLYAQGLAQAPSIISQKPLSGSPDQAEGTLHHVRTIMRLSEGLQQIKMAWGFWDMPIMQKTETI